MANLTVAFLTGLTTGGLSCLVVQGGLLASSVAHRVEQTLPHLAAHSPSRPTAIPKNYAVIITVFLMAKLVAYTLLGFGLGWLGSMLQLTPLTQALLQLGLGIFMVGSALRMFNVHPFFRYFAIEPPSFVTRYLRRTAKTSTDTIVTPLFLGALTVLIPCGVTQVMMATAIAAGNPLEGAAIMAAFTLGASPLFFTLAYLATQLGKALEARFMQVAAAIVLVLGLISINSGLNLAGVPLFRPKFADTRVPAAFQSAPPAALDPDPAAPAPPLFASSLTVTGTSGALPPSWKLISPAELGAPTNSGQAAVSSAPAGQSGLVTITVTDYGYEPQVVNGPANQPFQIKLVTNNSYG